MSEWDDDALRESSRLIIAASRGQQRSTLPKTPVMMSHAADAEKCIHGVGPQTCTACLFARNGKMWRSRLALGKGELQKAS